MSEQPTCVHCNKPLTPDEQTYYGGSCEDCERKMWAELAAEERPCNCGMRGFSCKAFCAGGVSCWDREHGIDMGATRGYWRHESFDSLSVDDQQDVLKGRCRLRWSREIGDCILDYTHPVLFWRDDETGKFVSEWTRPDGIVEVPNA